MRWLVVLFGLTAACAGPLRARLEITKAELEESLSEEFPLEKGGLLLALVLHDPEVLLTDGSEEIGIRLRISVGVGPVRVPAGRVGVAGKLSYDGESDHLLLHEPRIHTLEIEGPAREKEEEARDIINRVVHEVLPVIPLKEVEGSARWMIKSVTVRDGSVWVDVGL